jgi:hypothetical protein
MHVPNRKLIGKEKDFCGLEIPLAYVNTCLLSSWIKSYTKDDGKV